MNDHLHGDLQATLDACCCPRREGESFPAPRCAVLVDPCEREGPILVHMPRELECPCGQRAEYGEFCSDASRIRLYRDYRL